MGYHPTTRSREYREAWKGRRRTYGCRGCGEKFQVDTLDPVPEKARYCSECLKDPAHLAAFHVACDKARPAP